jgi:hypothetical protein
VSPRRFPPPWSVEETDACFIVRDATWQALAYVYFEEEPGRRAAAKLLTKDEGAADGGDRKLLHSSAFRTRKCPDKFRSITLMR